jgi:hypothetical protein
MLLSRSGQCITELARAPLGFSTTPWRASETPYLSIVAPAYDEVESVPGLDAELRAALSERPYASEIIESDDCPVDGSRDPMLNLVADGDDPAIEAAVLFLRRDDGQTAMAAGFAARARAVRGAGRRCRTRCCTRCCAQCCTRYRGASRRGRSTGCGHDASSPERSSRSEERRPCAA